ncbi:MAG: nucleoside hydrolase [Acidobacteria bacterium]|nr:nucleoside hydrolase [Acidobacteriota bacterium]
MTRPSAIGLAALLVVTACTSRDEAVEIPTSTAAPAASTIATVPVDPRRPVIFDYSPTVSDIGALAFLASHPDLRLVAVTLPGTGESHCEPGVAHTRGMLVELGYPEIPVACGPDDPTTGFNAFPTSWRLASNEMDLPEAAPNEDRTAPVLIADLVRGSDTPIEIVAVGPLTNLAVAFEADPTLAGLVAGITIMGGAVEVGGNVFKNDVAEWNIWVDPTAADTVLHSGAPVTLVPLDATNFLPAGRIFWESLDAQASTAAAALVRDVWAANWDWVDNVDGSFYFWDELAAAVLVDESLVTFETRTLVVDDETRQNKGWTRRDPAGVPVRVALTADRLAFEQLFLETLVGGPADLAYIETTEAEVAYFEQVERIATEADETVDVIFEETARGLGLDEAALEDGGFFDVVAAALPAILEGPWQDRIDALKALTVPESLVGLHDEWVAVLEDFAAAEVEVLGALETGDLEAFEPMFAPIGEACSAIATAAQLRLVIVQLNCF